MTSLEALSVRFRQLPTEADEPHSGVYLLVGDSDEVIYVGASIDVLARIDQHYFDKDFDHALWVPLPASVLPHYEGAFIRHLQPKLNQTAPADRGYDKEILFGFGLLDELLESDIADDLELCERLRMARIALGLTAEGLAETLGVARATYYSWESGTRTPQSRDLPRIAAVLHTTVAALYGEAV